MPIRSYLSIIQNISRGRFLPLLLAILLYLGLGPVFREVLRLRAVFDALFSIILFAGIYAVSRERRQMVIAVALALPMFAYMWTTAWCQAPWLRVTAGVSAIFFFGYAITLMGRFIVEAHRVTRDVVYAAIIVYLLIGLMWASIFGVLAAVQPGAFGVSQADIKSTDFILTYFSFVTLTTLGYGDIVPLTGPAYSLAILEAVIGQIYLTVLIARLVGLHIAQSQE
jgi:hypothetical protein